jgi:hypothetical protein
MRRVLAALCALSVIVVSTGCAFNEVSGQRVAGSTSTTALTAVDVIFVDRASMNPGGLGGLIGAPVPQGSMSRASEDLAGLMRELRDGAAAALAENKVPGRVMLSSERSGAASTASQSHAIVVAMQSATTKPQTPTAFVLSIEVLEVATKRSLWKGTSRVQSGHVGWTKEALLAYPAERKKKFGESLVQALRDAGVLTASPSKP